MRLLHVGETTPSINICCVAGYEKSGAGIAGAVTESHAVVLSLLVFAFSGSVCSCPEPRVFSLRIGHVSLRSME